MSLEQPVQEPVEPEYVYSTSSGTSGNVEQRSVEPLPEVITKQFLKEYLQITNEMEIGHVTSNGFELDFNKMIVGEKYIFDYFESKYMAIKNENGEVELSEITIHD